MYLTPKEILELQEIVDNQVLKFSVQNITSAYLTNDEIIRLKRMGISPENITPTIENAFKFGMISQAVGRKNAKDLTFQKIKTSLQSNKFLPLDYREKKALESLKFQAYHEIRGLGNRFNSDLNRILIEVDKKQRAEYEKVIQDAATKTIKDRGSVKYMSSLIGHKTGDWARDLDRISDFILHNAHDTGRAYQIKDTYKDSDPTGDKVMCYKMVFDQACQSCVKIYLTNGEGSAPRIFSVNELIANGTNIGRKKDDWKPVIGSTHPYCRCEMEALGVGEFEWDDKKQMFKMILNKRAKEISKQIKVKLSID